MSSTLFKRYIFCSLCFLPLLMGAQTNKNLTVGSTLTAGDDSSSPWLSPSGDFAFGFLPAPIQNRGFLLAIWFDKIPEKTVTWSANRDELAPPGSKLQLTIDGLILVHPDRKTTWSTTGGNADLYGAMLNSGNFILANASGDALWESFDEPTDTILPTQIMRQGSILTSRFSDTNFSNGRFQLTLQLDGNFVFYTVNWPQQSLQYNPYYTSDSNTGYQVIFNQSGLVNVIDKNNSIIFQVLKHLTEPTDDLYQRATFDFDGVFRLSVYQKSGSINQPGNWTMQNFVPLLICTQTGDTGGGGACGFNSYCEMGEDRRPKCNCPQGYSFIDKMDRLSGCKPDFVMQSCLDEEEDEFELIEMPWTDFVGANFMGLSGVTEESCRDSCLVDCFCAAVVLDGDKCWKKRFPMSNGISDISVQKRALIKVRIGNQTSQSVYVGSDKYRGVVRIESPIIGALIFFALAIVAMFFCGRNRQGNTTQLLHDTAGVNIRSFGYDELIKATNGFKEVIGQGAFATVYRGVVGLDEGIFVAIKKLNEFIQENQREFDGEVKAISKTGHRNLVQLLGFCNEERHRLLVYEYMPNGSLADLLFNGQRISLFRRINFAFEIAKGLNYLHEECNIQIIHCDIKPQNILLDSSFTARISDFGLAKLLKMDQTHTLTGVRGTKGYVAPEWFRSMPITTKVDVYSYGVLLLEIICSRRCFMMDTEDESQMVLADWAYDCYKHDKVRRLVKGDKEAMEDLKNVKKLIMVGLCCTQEDPSNRPSMSRVVDIIKGVLEESPQPDLCLVSYP